MLGKKKAMKKNRKSQIVSQWYSDYSRLLINNSLEILDDLELSKDMLQSTFERVIRNFDTINNLSENARAVYLVAINKSVCCDYLRKQKLETVSIEALDTDILASEMDANGINHFSNVEFLMDLERNLSKLKERDKNLILGKYVWNLSEEDLGKLVGLKTSSVHSALARAIKRLSKMSREEVQNSDEK